jgi:hypothetical protein
MQHCKQLEKWRAQFTNDEQALREAFSRLQESQQIKATNAALLAKVGRLSGALQQAENVLRNLSDRFGEMSNAQGPIASLADALAKIQAESPADSLNKAQATQAGRH